MNSDNLHSIHIYLFSFLDFCRNYRCLLHFQTERLGPGLDRAARGRNSVVPRVGLLSQARTQGSTSPFTLPVAPIKPLKPLATFWRKKERSEPLFSRIHL